MLTEYYKTMPDRHVYKVFDDKQGLVHVQQVWVLLCCIRCYIIGIIFFCIDFDCKNIITYPIIVK